MDKRRTARREADLSAEIYTRSEAVIPAKTENMSDEGVCLTLAGELPEGALVGVSLFPVDDGIEDPDAPPLNVPAKVVWRDKQRGPRLVAGMKIVDPENL